MIRVFALTLILALVVVSAASATSWGEIKALFAGDRHDGGGDPPPPPRDPPPSGLTAPGVVLGLEEFLTIALVALAAVL